MTTIAWRPGEMAADTLICAGDQREGEAPKAYQCGRVFAAATGCSMATRRFADWFLGGMRGLPDMDEPDPPTGTHGFLFVDDLIVWFTRRGCCEMRAPFYSLGSGDQFARGALAMGATPREAVAVAMRFDLNTGGEIQVWRA